jgi:hypothetical protein
MSLSHLPAWLSARFSALARWLQQRSARRLPIILLGILFACGRRTATSWFRAAGIGDDFRAAYATLWAVGRRFDSIAIDVLASVRPLLPANRLLAIIDDTPTSRFGPCIEGAGIHHNPTPGPAGEKFVYGHVWVTLAVRAQHPDWGNIALPLRADVYVRAKDLPAIPAWSRPPFRTKLQIAAEQLHWLEIWAKRHFVEAWVVIDGGYSKRPLLRAACQRGFVVVGRLPCNAALWSVPSGQRRAGQRGPLPTYGKERLDLAKRAGHKEGWEHIQCRQYGKVVTKKVKTFLATWHPAGGLIRVVLVQETDGWRAYFCTKATASAAEVLEAAAERGTIEETFRDVKEVWGAGEQQVRNLYANIGCLNLNLWMYALVEAWAFDKGEAELVDRSQSPWDEEDRRPSHADKRKALQRQMLREEIEAVLQGQPDKGEIRDLTERLLRLAG